MIAIYKSFIWVSFSENRKKRYQSVLYKLGELSTFHTPEEILYGKITGIADTGQLLLELDSGEMHSFGFKELIYK